MRNSQNDLVTNKTLCLVALVGTVLTGIYEIFSISDIKDNQVYSFYALILIAFGVCVSLFILRKTTVQIFKNPDLLVPIGLYITANTILSFGVQSSSFVGFRDGKFNFTGLSLTLILFWLVQVVISIFFTGWMTRTILQFVENGKVDLISPFQDFRDWFPRTFIYLVVGWIPIYLIMLFIFLPILSGGNAWSSVFILYPLIFLIGISALFWNLATAALLPYIISTKTNLKQSFKEGFQISWTNKTKTIIPILLLMLVSGWIVLISVNYSERIDSKADFGEISDSYSINNTKTFNYASNFVWTGNYPEASKWHSDLLKAVKEKPLSSVNFRIMLLMLFLSLVVNLKIIQEIWGGKDDENNAEDFFNSNIAVTIAGLILFLAPVEIFTQQFHNSSLLSSDSAKIPTTPQIIKGENFLNKQVFFEAGQGNTVDVRQKEDTDKFEVRGINNVAAGNLDSEDGQDVIVATGKGTLVLDTNGTIKKEISYQIEEPGKDNLNVYFNNQKVVDIDGDGICEFLNFDGANAVEGIYDFQGKLIVEFEQKPSKENLIVLASGDLDGNEFDELFSISNGEIKLFKPVKGEKIKAVFDEKIKVFDETGKGDLRLLTNPMQAAIKDGSGKELKRVRKPSLQSGYLIEKDGNISTLYFGQNHFGLFDLDGKLKAKYTAPLSEEEYGYFDKRDELLGGDLKVSIFKAAAVYVKLSKDKPKFLAVTAHQATGMSDFNVMLYIYDSEGELVYQELFDEAGTNMYVIPSVETDGKESLLISENKKIWKYTAQ